MDRPILFSGPMVRAILDGRKTMTRRIVKPAPDWPGPGTWRTLHDVESEGMHCPYGSPGDRLWVRETFSAHASADGGRLCRPSEADYVVLKDGTQVWRSGDLFAPLPAYAPGAFDFITWRPSIHMPRWASRITLEVTSVRVERLQDITEEDAAAEGFPLPGPQRTRLRITELDGSVTESIGLSVHMTARAGFCSLWDGINGKRAPWSANPWVWVVGFEVVR